MLSRTVARYAQTRVVTATPVEKKVNAAIGQRDDDLLQNRLARLGGGIGARPRRREIIAQRHQALFLRAKRCLRTGGRSGGEPLLLPAHIRQPVVPPSLQLGRDKAVSWIDGIVLALCQMGLVARLRQRQLCLPSDLGVVALTGLDGGQRRFDAERR